ncbi:o-succinylbenzoate synthase [Synechococcus sp. PCC 7336]|uniref:o-succinylbenzoate synthase n=1 Tax=Synechococcus sp. PCC 7336 TaxID=195250 RepID=UPI0003458F91|nr:o-succinylbenzoate synthase [Synechococcus sp. PCC 7336]
MDDRATYRFEFRRYRRPFLQPLHTHHGPWAVREGIVVRLAGGDRLGWGEIAPIPWFGTETVAEAERFCHSLGSSVSGLEIRAIPSHLSACRFALESARLELEQPTTELPHFDRCGLLPAGTAALTEWQPLWEAGDRTLKWKIGMADWRVEIALLEGLLDRLPATATVRLDANGGLDLPTAREWLRACDRLSIEFLEQPLPPEALKEMMRLSDRFSTPIALDESVARLQDLQDCYAGGWRGIFVVKPAIAGFPTQLQQFCALHQLDIAISSALETSVGRRSALRVAAHIGSHRAVGFGIDRWFPPEPPQWPHCLWQ